jgi:hypothetical protein
MRGFNPRIHGSSPLDLLSKTLALARPGIKHMKPPLPRILSDVPRTLHVQLEIGKAIRTLTSQDEDERLPRGDGKPSLEKAAADDPEHPGWPAGTPGGKGGQFRPKDSAANASDQQTETRSDVQAIITTARRLDLAARPDAYQRCLDLCYPLLERRQPPGSDFNTFDFHKCMNACLERNL